MRLLPPISWCASPPAPGLCDVENLHRCAARDAEGLRRALARHNKARSCTPNVEHPDAWGNTLLHTACASKNAAPQVARLLAAGARVNAAGPYGTTPLAAAAMARQFKAARLVRRAGGTMNLGRFNELSERSMLANMFGIDGITRLGGRRFELEGAFEFGVYPRLADAVEAFARNSADTQIFSPAMWQQAVRALRDAPSNCWLAPRTVMLRIRAGNAVLFPTGWRGHSVCVAFLGGEAVLADRAGPRSGVAFRPWRAWWFERGAPSIAETARLRDNRGRSSVLGQAALAWMSWRHQPHRERLLLHEHTTMTPKPQKAHNCTVANAKAALRALLLMLHARAHPRGRLGEAQLHREYKRLTTFMRVWALTHYRHLHDPANKGIDPPDGHLISLCEAKLTARGGRAAARLVC